MLVTDTIKTQATPVEILHPGSRMLFRYWEAVRGEMSAPPRDWLDLRQIRMLVPSLFMIERKEGQGFMWRLAGSRVCNLWGLELTGRPAFADGERGERNKISRLFDGVIDAHQPFVLTFHLRSESGFTIAAELVGTPLRARHGETTYVFGTVMPFREVKWSRNERVTSFEVAATRCIWTEPVPGANRLSKLAPAKSQQAFQVINGGRAD